MRTHPLNHRSRTARPLASVAVLALTSVLAAGCGDGDEDAGEVVTETVTVTPGQTDGGDTGEEGAATFTEEQAIAAILQPDNFSDAWSSEPGSDDDEEEPAPGCLGEIDALTEELPKAAEADSTYEYGDSGAPSVDSGLSAYADEAELVARFDEVQAALVSCTSVTGTDSDGLSYDLTLSADEDVTYDGVDDQINMTASGTVSQGEESLEIYLVSTMVRIGANVATIATTHLEDPADLHAVYAEIGVERAVAVATGDEPEATTAPDPA